MKTTTLTETMIAKVEAAIERNQRAMVSAAEKGRMDVADLCADHHKRLRIAANYLDERNVR
jgi:hypothetical protein